MTACPSAHSPARMLLILPTSLPACYCLLLPTTAYFPACHSLLLPAGPAVTVPLPCLPATASPPATACYCLQVQRSRNRFPACMLLPSHLLLPATAYFPACYCLLLAAGPAVTAPLPSPGPAPRPTRPHPTRRASLTRPRTQPRAPAEPLQLTELIQAPARLASGGAGGPRPGPISP